MDRAYIEQMRAHVDEGGTLTHKNAVELLAEVERLLPVFEAADRWCSNNISRSTEHALIDAVDEAALKQTSVLGSDGDE